MNNHLSLNRWLLAMACIAICVPQFSGCARRATAPAVHYNETDADLLSEKLDKMDWS